MNILNVDLLSLINRGREMRREGMIGRGGRREKINTVECTTCHTDRCEIEYVDGEVRG